MRHRKKTLVAAFFCCLAPLASDGAMAQQNPLLGEIIVFPYTFCPQGWSQTNGQTLQIAQNTALFSLLKNRYGGDGTSTFALPDVSPPPAQNGAALISCIAIQGAFPQQQ